MRIILPVTALALLALTGCAPAPTPDHHRPPPTAVPTVSASPTAEPETEPRAATIVLATLSFTVLDEDGALLHEYDYFEPAAAPIADLTEIFGAAPVITAFPGFTHQWPGSEYAWGGFSLVDFDGPSIAYGEDFDLVVRAAEVNGIGIEVVGGAQVGDTSAAGLAAGGVVQSYPDFPDITPWLEFDTSVAPDPEWADWDGGPRRFVYGETTGAGGPISMLRAPSVNYGP